LIVIIPNGRSDTRNGRKILDFVHGGQVHVAPTDIVHAGDLVDSAGIFQIETHTRVRIGLGRGGGELDGQSLDPIDHLPAKTFVATARAVGSLVAAAKDPFDPGIFVIRSGGGNKAVCR